MAFATFGAGAAVGAALGTTLGGALTQASTYAHRIFQTSGLMLTQEKQLLMAEHLLADRWHLWSFYSACCRFHRQRSTVDGERQTR